MKEPTTTAHLSDHFRGDILDLRMVDSSPSPQRDDVDMVAMARAGLNYLRGNPDPARGYECKFALGPLGIPCHVPISPPNKQGYNVVSLGDTDARMDNQYSRMREMVGEADACEVERGVRARLMSYLRDDGFSWVNPGACIGETIEGEWVLSWTTAKTLTGLAETYARTGEPALGKQCRKLFEALRSLALWDGPRAYIPGIAPWKDGQWLTARLVPRDARAETTPSSSSRWCGTGNAPATPRRWTLPRVRRRSPRRLAEGPGRVGHRSRERHFWEPRSPAYAHELRRGPSGAVTGERRYSNWVDKAFRFVVSQGTDFGWYPEFIPQGEWRTEICVVGDMMANAAWLARAGRPEYWDHLERMLRNQLPPLAIPPARGLPVPLCRPARGQARRRGR